MCETPVFGPNIPKNHLRRRKSQGCTDGSGRRSAAGRARAPESLRSAPPLSGRTWQERTTAAFYKRVSVGAVCLPRRPFSPQGTVEGLPCEVKEFQVFLPGSTTEVITKRKQNSCQQDKVTFIALITALRRPRSNQSNIGKFDSLFVQVLHHVHTLEPIQVKQLFCKSLGRRAVHLASVRVRYCRLSGFRLLLIGQNRVC